MVTVKGQPKTRRKRREINAENTRWIASEAGQRISVANQLGTDLSSNFYKNGSLLKMKTNEEDAKRIEAELIMVRLLSKKLEIPIWKVYDIVVARGLAIFIKEYWDKIMFMDKRQVDKVMMEHNYLKLYSEHIGEFMEHMENISNELAEEAFENLDNKKKK